MAHRVHISPNGLRETSSLLSSRLYHLPRVAPRAVTTTAHVEKRATAVSVGIKAFIIDEKPRSTGKWRERSTAAENSIWPRAARGYTE
jgi:hypothetical protein